MTNETIVNNKNNLIRSPICPVCNGQDASNVRDVYDDRYGHPDLFKLVCCDDCSHIMTTTRLSENDLVELYGTYYPRNNITTDQVTAQAAKVGLAFSKFRRWWMGIDNQGQYSAMHGEKMLDVGCGSGLSLLEAKELGVEAWGIEADPNVKRFADELKLCIHQGSLHDNPFEGITFDLIVLNQVIEHIPEPDKSLQLIRTRLTSNGRVILIFPNVNSFWCKLSGKHWINWHIPYHLHHFNLKTFTQMAERCDYNIVHTRTITPNNWTIMQLRAIRQSIVRGQSNPIWEVKSPVTSQQSNINYRVFIRKLLLPIVLIGITVVNRTIDSFGFGDSLMVELKFKDTQ